VEFSGRRESILGGFGLDILSRTPAELHPAKRRLTLCPPSVILREAKWSDSGHPAPHPWRGSASAVQNGNPAILSQNLPHVTPTHDSDSERHQNEDHHYFRRFLGTKARTGLCSPRIFDGGSADVQIRQAKKERCRVKIEPRRQARKSIHART